MHRLCFFQKIFFTRSPLYLYNSLPSQIISQRYPNCFNSYRCRTVLFQNSFFPNSVREWNQLNSDIRNTASQSIFRKALFKLVKPLENSVYNIHDALGIKLITRLRLGFSHLREHKFRHNFRDTLNPMCACSLEPENTLHFLLHCHLYDDLRLTLMSDLNILDSSISLLDDADLIVLILYGDKKYNLTTNQKILKATINFLKNSARFDGNLF